MITDQNTTAVFQVITISIYFNSVSDHVTFITYISIPLQLVTFKVHYPTLKFKLYSIKLTVVKHLLKEN